MPSLPQNTDLSGQTVIVTGATSGIGLAMARQVLMLKPSNVVLAVRNISKGETCKASLMSDPEIKAKNHSITITVRHFDAELPQTVKDFAANFRKNFERLDLLLINAGGASYALEILDTGHDKSVQVNYLSNVLLQLELLPLLEKTATITGRPSRVTWTGSRSYQVTSLNDKPLEKVSKGVLNYFDTTEGRALFVRYGDSKLLGLLFLKELAERYGPEEVIINSCCPHTVRSNMAGAMPWYIRCGAWLQMRLKGKTPDEAATEILHAALVSGKESHGSLFFDYDIAPLSPFVQSKEGKEVQRKLWAETVMEIGPLIQLPQWMTRST